MAKTKFRGVRGFFEELGVKMGIELELFMRDGGRARNRVGWFDFGGDLSISPDFGRAYELRTPVMVYKDLSKPYHKLKAIRGTTEVGVNSSCGTHIHISFHHTKVPFVHIIDVMAAAEGFFYSLGGKRGKGRISGGNSYARPVRSTEFFRSPVARQGNKFFSIHVYRNKPLRIEVRAFPGTQNPTRLVIYQAAVIGVAMSAFRSKVEQYRSNDDGMILTNRRFHDPLTSLKTWIDILDWKEGGRWTGFWYNIRRPPNGLPDEKKVLKWLSNALANFTRVQKRPNSIEAAYKEVNELLMSKEG